MRGNYLTYSPAKRVADEMNAGRYDLPDELTYGVGKI